MKFNFETAISCMVASLVALILFDLVVQPTLAKISPSTYDEYEEE